MTTNNENIHQQVFEAIANDAATFVFLVSHLQENKNGTLLFPGLLPHMAMFVVESQCCINRFANDPNILQQVQNINDFRQSRHRVKLLSDSHKTIDQIAYVLLKNTNSQKEEFNKPHTGFLGLIKRKLQPDLGISTYSGHIISTTHSTLYNFGEGSKFITNPYEQGKELAEYTINVVSMLNNFFISKTYMYRYSRTN